MSSSALHPSVVHLVTLFRQITAGELRIPAFQRGFVWSGKQIIELLESVKEAYPIGSLLLWNVESKILKIANPEITTFPDLPERFPTSYILDGMQRMSSLYGVFHFKEGHHSPNFHVFYDLRAEKFSSRDLLSAAQIESSIPLSALFNPRALLEYQSRIGSNDDGSDLIDRMIELQARFQEYLVPVVTMRETDVSRVVGVFERINSTGTPLSAIDFMRAITWAEDFDLTDHLEAAREWLDEERFSLADETIVKCISMNLGLQPGRDDQLKLRESRPSDLVTAFSEFRPCMGRVIRFLEQKFNIRSSEFVPYEGQLLVLYKTIGMGELVEADDVDRLIRWFWATGFNESLRGKPDHYVGRAIQNWADLIRGEVRGFDIRLKTEARDWAERRMMKGRALTTAFATMFAAGQARSIVTGGAIEPAYFMVDGGTIAFHHVFDREELERSGIRTQGSARIFANMILEDLEDIILGPDYGVRQALEDLARGGNADVLRSQFIDKHAADALLAGDAKAFLKARSKLFEARSRELVEGEGGLESAAVLEV